MDNFAFLLSQTDYTIKSYLIIGTFIYIRISENALQHFYTILIKNHVQLGSIIHCYFNKEWVKKKIMETKIIRC